MKDKDDLNREKIARDPEYTKVTPSERVALEEADKEMQVGDFASEDEVWDDCSAEEGEAEELEILSPRKWKLNLAEARREGFIEGVMDCVHEGICSPDGGAKLIGVSREIFDLLYAKYLRENAESDSSK